jgi:hypothetical protein
MISFKSLNGKCSGTISKANNGVITINGSCGSSGNVLKYIAASPVDLRASYMGSGLPFANPDMAYEGTVNRGLAPVVNGKFQITVQSPNSYYVKCGTMLILPHVHVAIGDEYFDIPLGDAIPSRSLSSLPGKPNRSTRR